MAPREELLEAAAGAAESTSPLNDTYGTMSNNTAQAPISEGAAGGEVGMTPLSSHHATNPSRDHNIPLSSTSSGFHYLPIDQAIEHIGTGYFQHKILLAAGLCFMADAMEVLLLSFLSTVLKHEWSLTEREVDSIVAVVFAGALMGTLVLGPAGDRLGRKPVFAVTAGGIALAGAATALCQTYKHLLVARFFVGFGVGGLTVPFDTLGEFLPSAARGTNLLSIEFFWTAGTLSVPALAYLTLDTTSGAYEGDSSSGSHWQLFVILCSIPCFLSALLGVLLVPESPRWLLEQQQQQQQHSKNQLDGIKNTCGTRALEILKAAAHDNGISQSTIDKSLFPPNTILVLSMDEIHGTATHSQAEATPASSGNVDFTKGGEHNNLGSFWELFKTPDRTRLTLTLWATWFGFGFLYYGVIIAVSLVFTNEEERESYDEYADDGQIEAEGGTVYGFDFAAIFITASAEIFGLIAVLGTIDSIGRIPSQTVAYRIGGVSTFVLGILCYCWIERGRYDGKDSIAVQRWSLIALAFVGRMAMMASSCTTWVSTSEMLSTEIRSTGHGAANAMARMGGFVAPYIITEGNSMLLIGSIVLLVSLATAECASRLPETAGKPMGECDNSSSDALTKGGIQNEKPRGTEEISYRELL